MSSSRGFFIGQLVDDLAAISYQVENRARLGYTDLNRMLEDFFKDVLNAVFDIHLINLNANRSNEPGLDLGDVTAKTAFQITSDASSAKVNDTLAKITDDQAASYSQSGAKMRPNGELPSDQYAARRTSDTGASKKGPSPCPSSLRVLRGQGAAKHKRR